MFVIGLEFNLPKLRSMRSLVFGLGLSQVALTMIGTTAGHGMLVWIFSFTRHALADGLAGLAGAGGAMAMSEHGHRREDDGRAAGARNRHGRRVIGVLLFQDLAVVPLLKR